MTWPQEVTQWSPEAGLQGPAGSRAGIQAPSWLSGSAPRTPCSWDALTLCRVQPAGLERTQGLWKGFWRAEPDNLAPAGFGSLTQPSPGLLLPTSYLWVFPVP